MLSSGYDNLAQSNASIVGRNLAMGVYGESAGLQHCGGTFGQIAVLEHSAAQDNLRQRHCLCDFHNPIYETVVELGCDLGNRHSVFNIAQRFRD